MRKMINIGSVFLLAVWITTGALASGRSFCTVPRLKESDRLLSVQTCRVLKNEGPDGEGVFGGNSAVITNRYFPLEVGTTYTYQGKGSYAGKSIVFKVLCADTADGVECVKVRYTDLYGTSEEWYAQDQAGNVWRLRQHNLKCVYPVDEYDEDDYLEMPVDPQEGEWYDVWDEYDEILSITDCVTVPAGTYSDCLKWTCVDDDVSDDYEYFAPHVGLIKSYDGDGRWELKSIKVSTPSLASQKITFPTLPTKALGDDDFDPGASASSGLTITYTSGNECVATITTNGEIHIAGAGTAVITASQSGSSGYKAAKSVSRTLTVKARVTAETPDGGGTVSGTGLYAPGAKVTLTAKPARGYTFLRWEDGTQAAKRSFLMPAANVAVMAWFDFTTNISPPEIANPGPQSAMVGVMYTQTVAVTSESLPKVTAKRLPAGLKFDASALTINGVPTKAGTFAVTLTASNPGGSDSQTFTITVDPLPAWAQGTFGGTSDTTAADGSASMSVTAKGAVSGKFSLCGSNFTFKAKNYTAREESGAFSMVVTAKVGKVLWPLSLTVTVPEITDTTGIVPETLSRADGVLGDADGTLTLYRNVWKDDGMATVLTNWIGYYTAVLPCGDDVGSGYLAFTVDKNGNVKTAGKLADGTSVSLSGPLLLDEAGRAGTVVYTAPSAYKGGWLFGIAEFIRTESGAAVVRPLDEGTFEWVSLNPAATGEYGVGFDRSLDLSGGWYDKLINLQTYYADGLTVGGVELPYLTAVLTTKNSDGTAREDIDVDAATDASPEGLLLSLNAAGSGFAAPKADTVVKTKEEDGTYTYDYATDGNDDGEVNTSALTFSFKKATGLFSGSFKLWYDYVSMVDNIKDMEKTAHTSKTVKFQGVLTPVRGDMSDGVAGRGYFLWKNTDARDAGKSYSFYDSYDFLLLQENP